MNPGEEGWAKGPDPRFLLNFVVNSLPIVVYAFDAAGTVLLSEGNALTGMASSPGAAVGRSVFEVFEAEPEVQRYLHRALAGEEQVANIRLRRNDRSYRVWYLPHRDADGRVVMVVGLSLDVTEARQTDRELRAAFQWLATIQDHVPIALFRIDAQGTITLARGPILPERARQSIGRPLSDAYAQYPEFVRRLESAIRGEDQTFSMSDGVRDFDFFVRGLRDEEGPQGALGIIVEVTEHRRAAAAALEAEWRQRFVAEIHHELRTPLNSMLGFADLLASPDVGSLTDRQRRYLDIIRTGGQHLLQLVNELLDVAKLRAGHLDVVIEQVDVGAVVDEAVERVRPIADVRSIVIEIGRRSPRPASGDRRRILQILLNLLANSVKFTPSGGRVSLKSYSRHGTLKVEVSDAGPGIRRNDLDRIFEDYVQLPGTEVIASGTGLGLPLSRRLARAMKGELTVRSSVGRGSAFILSLPIWTVQP